MQKLALGLMILLLSGCAYNKQMVTLNPTVNVPKSVVGSGVTVALKVVDDRANTSLGHRGNVYGAAAEITTNQDIALLVQDRIRKGLEDQGYRVVAGGASADRQLSFELRDLTYSTSQGFWTGGIEIAGALKTVGRSGSSSYEQLYRVDDKQRVVVVPTAETNAVWMNTALSELLQKVFSDTALDHFLTTGT
ncbi:hypothetical protein BJI69_19785 [Luteibacter rhizovicinus DSM 16549]|uniref:Lipoprotein n=3 Tax=Luteibacter rhizovicinus TaxID=242606 RepID=A0A1L3EXY3_9GAMM|nr:hypothetical protein BJI69_19785 [Luteibacter rhizovicinus DSM 16549]